MKRKYILAFKALIICLTLMACGSNNTSSNNETDATPNRIDNLAIDDSINYDYSNFLGTWLGEDDSKLIVEEYTGIRYELSDINDELLASGNLQYMEEYGYVYAYNEHDGIAYRCWFGKDNTLYLDSLGTFSKVSGDIPGETIGDESDNLQDNSVPVLLGGALPFTNMQNLQSENYEDGTYYYSDVTEDGQLTVINMVQQSNFASDTQTLEDYLSNCALSLGDTDTYTLQNIEKNDEYTQNMSYPVYIVTYTAGENEDTRRWTVFAMDTDRYTYLYGFCSTLDAADDMESVYEDIFSGLYLYDEE